MTYRLIHNSDFVLRLPDHATIPPDEGNGDWRDYQAWLAGGGVPEPAEVPQAPVPDKVTLAQARVALRRRGLLSTVNTAMTQAGGEAADAWEYGNYVSRNSTLVGAMAQALSLSPDDVDELFVEAAAIDF